MILILQNKDVYNLQIIDSILKEYNISTVIAEDGYNLVDKFLYMYISNKAKSNQRKVPQIYIKNSTEIVSCYQSTKGEVKKYIESLCNKEFVLINENNIVETIYQYAL